MTIKLGSTDINQVYLGSTEINKIYLGSTLLFDTTGGGGGGSSTLADISGLSVAAELDGSLAAPSGQTWANQITSPDDGASQTDHDFFLGGTDSASTDDPTFNATSERFEYDGGDYLSYADTGSNGMFNTLHQSEDFWMAFCFKIPTGFSNQVRLFENNTDSPVSGFRVALNSGSFGLRLFFGVNGSYYGGKIADYTDFSEDTDLLLVITFDGSSGDMKYAINSSSFTTDSSFVSLPSNSDDASNKVFLGTTNSGYNFFEDGSEFWHFSAGPQYIGNTELASIKSALETRHGVTYS